MSISNNHSLLERYQFRQSVRVQLECGSPEGSIIVVEAIRQVSDGEIAGPLQQLAREIGVRNVEYHEECIRMLQDIFETT